MFLEIGYLFLDAVLLLHERRVSSAVVGKYAVLQVGRFIDLALVTVQRKVVVSRKGRRVIQATAHQRQLSQEGRHLVILHPEHGILRTLATPLVCTFEHGA